MAAAPLRPPPACPVVLLRPLLLLPKVVPAFPDSGSWVSVLLLWFESLSLWPVLKHLHPGPCCCGQLAAACPCFPFLSCLWGLPPFTWSLPPEAVTTELPKARHRPSALIRPIVAHPPCLPTCTPPPPQSTVLRVARAPLRS